MSDYMNFSLKAGEHIPAEIIAELRESKYGIVSEIRTALLKLNPTQPGVTDKIVFALICGGISHVKVTFEKEQK
jgi:hypothetical protein